jgi:outer membrane lipoprotein-sorting protein
MEIRGWINQMVIGMAVLVLSLYPSLALPSEAGAGMETRLSSIVRSVKDREKSLKTFVAHFSQTKKSSLLRDPLFSSGAMYFEAGGAMFIKVTTPSPMNVLLKDRMLTISYPDLSETRQRYLGVNLTDYFGIGESFEEMQKRFSMRIVSETPPEKVVLELIPKSGAMAKRIASIQVRVSLKTSLPEIISIFETGGDETDIRLEFISFNEPLPPEIFSVPVKEDRQGGGY